MENEIHIPTKTKEVKTQIDSTRIKNIKDVDEYRKDITAQIKRNPVQFYLDYLVDLRILLDDLKAKPNTSIREVLAAEKSWQEAWSQYSRLTMVSATDQAKIVTDLAKSKANPDAIKELYGEKE